MMHDAHIYKLTVSIFGIESGGECYILWNNSLFKLVEYKVCVDFKLPNQLLISEMNYWELFKWETMVFQYHR